MKKIILILVAVMLLLSCCVKNENDATQYEENTQTPIIQNNTTEPSPTPEPTEFIEITAEPVPENPKYIFIIIGDGMGQGAASLGEAYVRLANEDMDAAAVWENFPVHRIVGAMGDSSSGGTAISTGCQSRQGYVALNLDEEPLYTIMDRAKEAGMSTGVITNSHLSDATPATFLSHTLSRYNYAEIASVVTESNVDYIAGGGLGYFGSEVQRTELPDVDCYGIKMNYGGRRELMPNLMEAGYSMYYGMEGAVTMLSRLENGEYPFEKSVYSLSASYMPWEIDKYSTKTFDKFENVPSLDEMAVLGINTLSQNPDGFVMMIEEAFIDRAAHMSSTLRAIYQMKLLNETMLEIMEFYNEHPNDTLIILTADHETGNYLYNEELFSEFKQLPDFEWFDNGKDLENFLIEEWGFYDYESYYYTQIHNSQSDVWQDEDSARTQTLADITLTVTRKYGTIITTGGHSRQDVPLYVMGNGSEHFEQCEHISQIPTIICEMLGWEPLPAVLPDKEE